MTMEHYTFDGELVEETDPRAAYQVNPNTPAQEKQELIEAYKKLAPLVPVRKEKASTLAEPNGGIGGISGVQGQNNTGLITSNIQETAKELTKEPVKEPNKK